MHRHHPQDEAKVAVYCAHMPAAEDQGSQDLWLVLCMTLSALTIIGLRCLA